eukprot:GEMP01082307.1.p1 GENE.GEMP01082307.1~~GEMP01082307.1.p1  ORF type:complete len:210 (+),score=19.04 GEMP01082307.1:178-807(+)
MSYVQEPGQGFGQAHNLGETFYHPDADTYDAQQGGIFGTSDPPNVPSGADAAGDSGFWPSADTQPAMPVGQIAVQTLTIRQALMSPQAFIFYPDTALNSAEETEHLFWMDMTGASGISRTRDFKVAAGSKKKVKNSSFFLLLTYKKKRPKVKNDTFLKYMLLINKKYVVGVYKNSWGPWWGCPPPWQDPGDRELFPFQCLLSQPAWGCS